MKNNLRIRAKDIRKKLNIKEKSKVLAEKLINTKEYQQAQNIMLYYPVNSEIDLREILTDKTKNFYLPKINGNELLCCSYKSGDKLCLSCFKTLEPITESTKKTVIDIAIIPALAVDIHNYRLGYGGGFYDRFLKDYNGTTITCIPNELIFDTVYPEKHDIAINHIITD